MIERRLKNLCERVFLITDRPIGIEFSLDCEPRLGPAQSQQPHATGELNQFELDFVAIGHAFISSEPIKLQQPVEIFWRYLAELPLAS